MPRAYSSVNLTPDALARLRRTTLDVSAQLGRRVPTSDVVSALVTLGERYPAELAQVLSAPAAGSDAP